jgi:hypothetical protein
MPKIGAMLINITPSATSAGNSAAKTSATSAAQVFGCSASAPSWRPSLP